MTEIECSVDLNKFEDIKRNLQICAFLLLFQI